MKIKKSINEAIKKRFNEFISSDRDIKIIDSTIYWFILSMLGIELWIFGIIKITESNKKFESLINNNSWIIIVGLILIIVFCAFLSRDFYKNYINNYIIKLNKLKIYIKYYLPKWIQNTIICFLLILILYLFWNNLNRLTFQSTNSINGNISSILNKIKKIFSLLISFGLISVLLSRLIFEHPDFRVEICSNHQFGNKDLEKTRRLTVFGTNIGKTPASYKYLGICAEEELGQIYAKKFISKLPQPKFFSKDKQGNILRKSEFKKLGEGEVTNLYNLVFTSKVPSCYLVFLQAPNKIITFPIKNNNENPKKNKYYMWAVIRVIIVIFGFTLIFFNSRSSSQSLEMNNITISTSSIDSKRMICKPNSIFNKHVEIYSTKEIKPKNKIVLVIETKLSSNNHKQIYYKACELINNENQIISAKIINYGLLVAKNRNSKSQIWIELNSNIELKHISEINISYSTGTKKGSKLENIIFYS